MKLSLTDVTNLNNPLSAVTAFTANNSLIENAIENTLSRDGTSPNQMLSPLDMNNNPILNLPLPTTLLEPVRNKEFSPLVGLVNQASTDASNALAQVTAAFTAAYKNDLISVADFGAIADCTDFGIGTDNRNMFQAAFDYAATHGTDLYIPPGKYRISQSLYLTNTNDVDGRSFRPSIRGGGSRATFLMFDPGNYDGVTITGFSAIQDTRLISGQRVSGFSLHKSDAQGHGLSLNAESNILVEDITISQWNYGVYGYDVQESTFINCTFVANYNGGYFIRSIETQPNALEFFGCSFLLNQNTGLDVINPCVLGIFGGTIASNGGPGPAIDANKWAIRLAFTVTTVEANCACMISGVYFERNAGRGDIYIVNSVVPMSYSIHGCTFNRSWTYKADYVTKVYGTNVIQMEGSGYPQYVSVVGCGVGNLPRSGPDMGVPDPSRPVFGWVGSSTSWHVSESGCSFADAVERVDLGSKGLNNGTHTSTSAYGVLSDTSGTLARSANIASVVKQSTGTYLITFLAPLARNVYHANFTILGATLRQWTVTGFNTTNFTVQFFDKTGTTLTDTQFSFAVTGGGDV